MTAIDRIQEILQERGMTQSQLSDLSGLALGTINRILKGKQELKPNTLNRIADALEVSIYEIAETEQDASARFSVIGYLDYCGEIYRIKSLKDLKKHVQSIEQLQKCFKYKEKKLPKQKPISLDDIDYYRWETIDATIQEVKSFKSGEDIVDGERFNVGNMCSGFPFLINGEPFNNSEAAYIAGMFSNDNSKHLEIQRQLQNNNDGYAAKKQIRMRNQNIARPKDDWETFNVEWMKYVVWQKCKSNHAFADMLRSIPETAFVVENSTGMTGETAQFWGAFNQDLMDIRDAKEKRLIMMDPKAKKDAINVERNKWKNVGKWTGVDCMGKIIKACSLCLIHGMELPIDYQKLKDAKIYLFGKLMTFDL